MTQKVLSAEEIAATLSKELGKKITSSEIREWTEGLKKTPLTSVWIQVAREDLLEALRAVIGIDYPHLGVISGADRGDVVELLYHMTVFFGTGGKEVLITISIDLPKKDLRVPTITSLIPGAGYGEREKQEMLGVVVEGTPDNRGLFLPADFPEGVYPWRKDETGIPDSMVKDLWAVGRPENRPNPPVKPKEKKEKKEAVKTGKAADASPPRKKVKKEDTPEEKTVKEEVKTDE